MIKDEIIIIFLVLIFSLMIILFVPEYGCYWHGGNL